MRSWAQRAFGFVSLSLIVVAVGWLIAYLLPESGPPAVVVLPSIVVGLVVGVVLYRVIRRRVFLHRVVRPADAAMAAGDHARAVALLKAAGRRRPVPEAQYVCHALAMAHFERGEHRDALVALRRLAKVSPELPQEALRLWLEVALAANDEDAAREALAWPDPASLDDEQKREHAEAERRVAEAFTAPE